MIEVIVVIAIIAILAGMLMPALQKVREEGRRIVCMNNLNQIGKAIYLYANDYGGYFVRARWFSEEPCWQELLMPYLGNEGSPPVGRTPKGETPPVRGIYQCPSGNGDISCTDGLMFWYYYSYLQMYGVNSCLGGDNLVRIENVPRSSEKILVGEIQHPADIITHYAYYDDIEYGYITVYPDNEFPEPITERGQHLNAYRHNDGANFLFCDGHVEWWPRLGKDWKNPDIEGAYNKHWDLTAP